MHHVKHKPVIISHHIMNIDRKSSLFCSLFALWVFSHLFPPLWKFLYNSNPERQFHNLREKKLYLHSDQLWLLTERGSTQSIRSSCKTVAKLKKCLWDWRGPIRLFLKCLGTTVWLKNGSRDSRGGKKNPALSKIPITLSGKNPERGTRTTLCWNRPKRFWAEETEPYGSLHYFWKFTKSKVLYDIWKLATISI